MKFLAVVFLLLSTGLISCHAPPVPPEVEEVQRQEHDLWRAGALLYAPEEYKKYLRELRLVKDKFIKQKSKFVWFRDYKEVKTEFTLVLAKGEEIGRKIQERKDSASASLSGRLAHLRERMDGLEGMSRSMNEGHQARRYLAQAEVAYGEAQILFKSEKYGELGEKINTVSSQLDRAEEALLNILVRYLDDTEVVKWQRWAAETIAESKKTGQPALIVSKLERKLTLYKRGAEVASYPIGLGRYGLSDKLYAGDEATPEGKYKIVKKLAQSRYYRALLINYPNEEDKKQFAQARKKGLVPKGIGIGGLIEIHGGGQDSITNGCVSVENEVMDKIFPQVSVGTPVTIIGSLKSADSLLASFKNLKK